MSEQKDEKWLDELISRTINTTEPEFDPGKWKEKYPEEFQMLLSRVRKRPPARPNIWVVIFKSSITKIAAAAVVIVAIGLFIAYRGPGEQGDKPRISQTASSPADMMTAMSLTMAYRRGGIEALERQCEQALKMLGSRPISLSLRDIFENSNG